MGRFLPPGETLAGGFRTKVLDNAARPVDPTMGQLTAFD